MGTVTIKAGHIEDGNGVIVNIQSVHPPFQKGVAIHCEEYKVGTDFASGDDLVFDIQGTDKVRYAHFTNNVGATVQYVEAVSGTGLKLTLTNCTTNIKSYIVWDT